MQIKEVMTALERFAPLSLQESYDNAGFQVGLTEAEVSGVLLCLDVTEAAVRAAAESGCNLIVAHHPLLFHGLKCVGDATQPERCVRLAIQLGVAVYAAHTNLDNAPGGVCFTMAGRLGLTDVRSLTPQHRADGHYESEQYAVDLLASILRDAFPGLTLRQFGSTNPVFYH